MSWSKPPVITPDVPLTPEQILAKQKQDALAKIAKTEKDNASEIVRQVQAIVTGVSSKPAGYSANYAGDALFTAKGSYTANEINIAKTDWLALYANNVAYNAHVMGPSPKYTGGRNGQIQADFIRKIETNGQGRYNVHVNQK
jgi:hypothetical protein